jgi:hypothetical protein
MKNTADMIGGKPIAVWSQSISDLSATFYDIHGGKRELLFYYFVPDTTRDFNTSNNSLLLIKYLIIVPIMATLQFRNFVL